MKLRISHVNKFACMLSMSLLGSTATMAEVEACDTVCASPERQAEVKADLDAQMEVLTEQLMGEIETELVELAEEIQDIHNDPLLHLKVVTYMNLLIKEPEFRGYDPELVRPDILTEEELDALSEAEDLAYFGVDRQMEFQMSVFEINLILYVDDPELFRLDALNILLKDSLPTSLEDIAALGPQLAFFLRVNIPYEDYIDDKLWGKIKARYSEDFVRALGILIEYKELSEEEKQALVVDASKAQKDFTPQLVSVCRYLVENYNKARTQGDMTQNELLYLDMGMRGLAMWIFITETWGDLELSVEDQKLFYGCLRHLNDGGILNILKYAKNYFEPQSSEEENSTFSIKDSADYLVPDTYLKKNPPISTDNVIRLCSEKLDQLFPERKTYQPSDWQVL